MSIPIKHYGLYRFRNYCYNNDQLLNAYGSTSLVNGRNVILYTRDDNDTAQQWRAMYAGVYDNHILYWLNCALGGTALPFALDRFTGTLADNADVYKAADSSARDQLVYFTEAEETGAFYIHLYNIYDSNTAASTLVLTAAPNPNGVNGNNAPTSLTQAGNVYWANLVEGDTAQQWVIETVIAGEDPYTSDWATNFPTNSYYVNDNNESYPKFVGECTWYCKGRFLEVNNIANCASGHAATWINNYNASTCDCDTTNKTLREKSIAVFGSLTDPSAYGHVVFIESLTQNYVCFSECNVMATLSNGEIEVRNSLLPNAMDGYRQSITKAEFSSLYGYQLLGIIYKK